MRKTGGERKVYRDTVIIYLKAKKGLETLANASQTEYDLLAANVFATSVSVYLVLDLHCWGSFHIWDTKYKK